MVATVWVTCTSWSPTESLPDTMSGFSDLVNIYFPSIYDIKHLMKFWGVADSGLDDLANIILDVKFRSNLPQGRL